MNVTCPNCATIYRVDPAKVPEAGVRARCAVCAAVFPVRRDAASVASAGAAPEAAPPAPAVPAPPVPASAIPAPGARSAPLAQGSAEPPRPAASEAHRREEAPPAPQVAPAAPPAAPIPVPPGKSEPSPARPDPAPRPAFASTPPSRPAQPVAPPVTPPAAPRSGVARPAGLPPVTGASRPAVPSRPATPFAAPAAAATGAAGAARKPVNPFLSQDPGQKARRLARALISDMVVYHPAKRREGLRDGTLKTLFEDEIKKSWEEYTDQVGRDVAESTTHFKDALNEILADGRQIF